VWGLLAFAATAATGVIGYFQSKEFVRRKLRYVDSALNPIAPVVAGVGAWLVAIPIVALLPIVGAGTAIVFGASVGVGVAAGAREIRRSLPPG
jgi:hypothetical protein